MRLTRHDTEKVCQLLMAIPNSFVYLNSEGISDEDAFWMFFEIIFQNGAVELKPILETEYPDATAFIAPDDHWMVGNSDMAVSAMVGYEDVSKQWHGIYADDIWRIKEMQQPICEKIHLSNVEYFISRNLKTTSRNLIKRCL
jgi:hypothetical protein